MIRIRRRFIFKEDTRLHAHGTDLGGGLVERLRVRRHCGPLCSKLVAAVSSSICISVVSVSGVGIIVLSEQTVVVAEGIGPAGQVELPGNNDNVDQRMHTLAWTPFFFFNTQECQRPADCFYLLGSLLVYLDHAHLCVHIGRYAYTQRMHPFA